jgi:hypothetical protein
MNLKLSTGPKIKLQIVKFGCTWIKIVGPFLSPLVLKENRNIF